MIVHSFDIGGSSVKSGLVRILGSRAELLGPARSLAVTTGDFADYERAVLAELAASQAAGPAPEAVAISTTGQLASDGTMLKSGLIRGYDGVSWPRILAGRAGDLPVTVTTDGQASALAEYYAGGGADPHVHAVAGTGIGGGVVSGGRPVVLPESAGGRLGHVKVPGGSPVVCSCGSRGCCEPLAAAPAIVRRYNAQVPVTQQLRTVRDVALRAAGGDLFAVRAFGQSGYWLGRALGIVLRTLRPAAITLGGGVALASRLAGPADLVGRDPYLAGVNRALQASGISASHGKLGNDAGIIGAARLAAGDDWARAH